MSHIIKPIRFSAVTVNRDSIANAGGDSAASRKKGDRFLKAFQKLEPSFEKLDHQGISTHIQAKTDGKFGPPVVWVEFTKETEPSAGKESGKTVSGSLDKPFSFLKKALQEAQSLLSGKPKGKCENCGSCNCSKKKQRH